MYFVTGVKRSDENDHVSFPAKDAVQARFMFEYLSKYGYFHITITDDGGNIIGLIELSERIKRENTK